MENKEINVYMKQGNENIIKLMFVKKEIGKLFIFILLYVRKMLLFLIIDYVSYNS